MIRCVPFDYYGTGRDTQVAFLDTVTDKFIELNGAQCWGSKRELLDWIKHDEPEYPDDFIDQLLRLTPMWFFNNHEEKEVE